MGLEINIEVADLFRNEASYCPYEWVTESLVHSIRSKPWIYSVMKQLGFSPRNHNCSFAALFESI